MDLIALQKPLPLSVSLNHAIIIHLVTKYVKYLFGAKSGRVSVISATRALKLLDKNEFDAIFTASPTVAGNAMILRSLTHLTVLRK